MSTYVISYDLCKPGRDYQRLYDYLKSYAYAHVVESTWVISTYKTAAQVRDDIRALVDGNDQVLVIQTTNNAAWIGLPVAIGNWLKQHLVSAA